MQELKLSLKAARVNADMTAEEAAKSIGVTTRTLTNWENGKTYPSTTQIEKIEKTYNVSIANIRFS